MSDLITKLMEFFPVWVLTPIIIFLFRTHIKALTNYKSNPDSFNAAAAWLKNDTYGKTYRNLLGKMLDKLADWLGDRSSLKPRYIHNNKQSYVLVSNNRFFTNNPFTPASYERLLQLAFIYPILSFLIFWAMGGDGRIADIDWLDDISTVPENTRWQILFFSFVIPLATLFWLKHQTIKKQIFCLVLATILVYLVSMYLGVKPAYKIILTFWRMFVFLFVLNYLLGWIIIWIRLKEKLKIHQLIYPFVFAFAFTFAFAFSVAGTNTATSAVAGISAFVGTIFYWQNLLQNLSWNKLIKRGVLFYTLLFIVFAVILLGYALKTEKIFLLFCLLLPLLNAPIDWLSLGITRGLLQSIRHQHHSGWLAFAWALLDALLAIFFLLLVSAVLVLAIGLVDSELLHTILIEISDIIRVDRFCVAKTDNYNWLYTMLLTTLIPTLAHFAIAASALTLWLPQKWRHNIADRLQYNYYKQIAAATYLTITPFIGLLAPIALLYGLYLLLNAHGGMLANMLLNWAELLAGLF